MAIRLITQDEVVSGVSKRWDDQYGDSYYKNDPEKQDIGLKLRSLKNPSASQINKIIGNGSWTRLECDCCEEPRQQVVHISSVYRDGLNVCRKCLKRAMEKLT
jgi:hypothetical protein